MKATSILDMTHSRKKKINRTDTAGQEVCRGNDNLFTIHVMFIPQWQRLLLEPCLARRPSLL